MKKALVLVLALALLVSSAAFAQSALNATETAKLLAPAGYQYAYTEKDGEFYEVHFLNEVTFEDYEIVIRAQTGLPVKIDSSLENAKGSAAVSLTEEAARQIVLNEYPDAVFDGVVSVMDDGLYELRVYFKTDALYGIFELNPETGAVLERELLFGTPEENWHARFEQEDDDIVLNDWNADPAPAATSKPAKENKASGDSQADFISVSQAKGVITGKYSGAKITEIEFDRDDGKYVYEGEAVYNGREYDFEINAVTGKLLKWERD